MQYPISMVPVVFLAACATTQPPTANTIANAGVESWLERSGNCPDQWACGQHTGKISYRFASDATIFIEGKRSLSIERIGPEDWATVSQFVDAKPLRGKTIRVSAQLKKEKVEGLGAGLMLIADGADAGETAPLITAYTPGTKDWHRVEIVAKLPRMTGQLRIGLALEGSGKVWVDDFNLEVVPER